MSPYVDVYERSLEKTLVKLEVMKTEGRGGDAGQVFNWKLQHFSSAFGSVV